MIAAEPKAPAERRQQLLPIGQLAFASCTSEEQLEVMEAAFEQRERLPVGTARAAVGLLKAIAKEARMCSCPLAATARRNICYAQRSAECAQVALGAFDPATFRRVAQRRGGGFGRAARFVLWAKPKRGRQSALSQGTKPAKRRHVVRGKSN